MTDNGIHDIIVDGFPEDSCDLDAMIKEREKAVSEKKRKAKNKKIIQVMSFIMAVLAFVIAYIIYYMLEYFINFFRG